MVLRVQVMKPTLPLFDDAAKYLRLVDETRVYSNRGPLVQSLESRFSTYLNVNSENVVLCSSATLGIQGACFLSDVPGFYVPSYTFTASALAVISSGKELKLLDINIDNWQIKLQKELKNFKYGIVNVIPFGANINLSAYDESEKIIFDAAASLGNPELNLSILSKNHIAIFSLHATKVMGIGEGGLVVFGDSEMASEFRSYINFGFIGSRESKILGTNAKMSEFQAAYGLAMLDSWNKEKEEWVLSRNEIKKIEAEFPTLFRQNVDLNISPYWISLSDPDLKKEIVRNFSQDGIETRDWWGRGVHNMSAFSQFQYGDFLNTEFIADSSVGLPFYRKISTKELDLIFSSLINV